MSTRRELIKEIGAITNTYYHTDCRKILDSLQTYHSIVNEKVGIVLAFRFLLVGRCILDEVDFMRLYSILEEKL